MPLRGGFAREPGVFRGHDQGIGPHAVKAHHHEFREDEKTGDVGSRSDERRAGTAARSIPALNLRRVSAEDVDGHVRVKSAGRGFAVTHKKTASELAMGKAIILIVEDNPVVVFKKGDDLNGLLRAARQDLAATTAA